MYLPVTPSSLVTVTPDVDNITASFNTLLTIFVLTYGSDVSLIKLIALITMEFPLDTNASALNKSAIALFKSASTEIPKSSFRTSVPTVFSCI